MSASPALTLVILLPPLSKPDAVNLTSLLEPPVGALIEMPSVFITVLPVVTLSKVTSLAVATVNLPPVRVISMLSPLTKSTLSPDLMNCPPVSPLALAVKPELLTALTTSPAVTKAVSVGVLATPPVLVMAEMLAVNLPSVPTLMVASSVLAATV